MDWNAVLVGVMMVIVIVFSTTVMILAFIAFMVDLIEDWFL